MMENKIQINTEKTGTSLKGLGQGLAACGGEDEGRLRTFLEGSEKKTFWRRNRK